MGSSQCLFAINCASPRTPKCGKHPNNGKPKGRCSWRQLEDIRVPSHSQAMSFFESEIVQQESKRLFEDYQQLMRLGSDYGKFDREGKRLFIAQMEALMERYRIFMKRFELSDDFQARMTVEQLKTQLGPLGITLDQMFDQMKRTLEQMRRQTTMG